MQLNLFVRHMVQYVVSSLIYLLSFLLLYYLRNHNLILETPYIIFISLIMISWLLASLLVGKYETNNSKSSLDSLTFFLPLRSTNTLFISFFLMIGLLSFFSLFYELSKISRYITVGSLFMGLVFEYLLITFSRKRSKTKSLIQAEISFIPIVTELLSLIYSIGLVFIFGFKYKTLSEIEILSLVCIFVSWLISSIFTHRFEFNTKENYWRLIWKYIKSYIILGALVTFIVFMLRLEWRESLYILFGIIVFAILSLLILTFIYVSRQPAKVDEVKTKFIRATDWLEERIAERNGKSHGKYAISGNLYNPYLAEQLSGIYLKAFPKIYRFIEEKIDLLSFDFRKSAVIRSADTYNIEVLPDNSLEFYMNLHQLNDIRRINLYLIHVNQKLEEGGIFIGCMHPNYLRFQKFLTTYPSYLARAFYFIDFLLKRVTPKLPFVKKFYFTMTKGKNRALSLAEGLGRLYYCGFEIVGLQKIDGYIYFQAKKVKSPLEDVNPSYGPLIRLKRIGEGGRLIKVYKLRTMHPYSEYLQKFVYDMNELEEGGKLKDDFRITSWGKIMRKLWLDELPMFINFFKGELKLVGIRPLSNHYFHLYDEKFRERRKKYKPGLVPPFYMDMPKTLHEIIASEEKYFDEYDKHPFIADIKYFFGAWYNILIKKARSA